MNRNKLLLISVLCIGINAQAQKSYGAVNSGASSNSKNPYSVGEIFVIGSSTEKNISGTIGAFSTMILKSENGLITTNENDIFAFPNPTERTLKIQTNSHKLKEVIQIFDLNGKLVISQKLVNNELDLSSLSNGSYLIKISETKTIKIQKQ
jgi:putative heme degradation protein